MKLPVAAVALASTLLIGAWAATQPSVTAAAFELAQAMVPPTGMMDAQHPMPMNERYLKRLPQPARVGDLIGLPVLDLTPQRSAMSDRSCTPRPGRSSSSSATAGGGVGGGDRSRCHWKSSA